MIFEEWIQKAKLHLSKNSVIETVNPGYLERKEQKRVDSAKKKAAVRSNEATVAEMSKKKKTLQSTINPTPRITREEAQTFRNKRIESMKSYGGNIRDIPPYAALLKSRKNPEAQDNLKGFGVPSQAIDTKNIDNLQTEIPKKHVAVARVDLKSLGCKCGDLPFANFRLAGREEMDSNVASFLCIRTGRGDIVSKLSALEVYSASHLWNYFHKRATGRSDFFPKNISDSYHFLSSANRCYIDPNDILHVVRPGSSIFESKVGNLLSLDSIRQIFAATVRHGTHDTLRSPSQFRLNIGCGGLSWVNGSPAELIGLDTIRRWDEDDESLKLMLGNFVEFVWKCMVAIQSEANLYALAGDEERHTRYASKLNQLLGMNSCVSIEDVTIVASVLAPNFDGCSGHKDGMNDSMVGYDKTGCLNVCLCNDDGIILHLQVILNYRRVLKEHCIPFYRGIDSMVSNAERYLQKVQHDLNHLFRNEVFMSGEYPTPFNKRAYFLSDDLQYQQVDIGCGVKGEYILQKIGPSRIFSMSMFLDPIHRLPPDIDRLTKIELCFIISLLNNPFRFRSTMMEFIEREEPLGQHPFYCWYKRTTEKWNGKWQGGPFQRWSPVGGMSDPGEWFGGMQTSTKSERLLGEAKLKQVINKLSEYLEWVDGFLGKGKEPAKDMPIQLLHAKAEQVSADINLIVPSQFSCFRLAVFLTAAIGSGGLLKEGVHLRQMTYPAKGCASYNHLTNPSGNKMSSQLAESLAQGKGSEDSSCNYLDNIPEKEHDRAMMGMSKALGRPMYFRDEMECVLVSSLPTSQIILLLSMSLIYLLFSVREYALSHAEL